MPDYTSNSKKSKEKVDKPKIESVVVGPVVQKAPSVGRKFRETFFGGSLKMAGTFVLADVLLPALRNLVVDAATNGVRSIVYGDHRARTGSISNQQYAGKTTYNTPVNRGMVDPRGLPPGPRLPDQQRVFGHGNKFQLNEIILLSKDDAQAVIERMLDILSQYETVSVADLWDLLELPSQHTDNNYGWSSLIGIGMTQVREGYRIDLPPVEVIV